MGGAGTSGDAHGNGMYSTPTRNSDSSDARNDGVMASHGGGRRRPQNGGGGGHGSASGYMRMNANSARQRSSSRQTPGSNRRRNSNAYNHAQQQMGNSGGRNVVARRGSQDMRELTAALMQAREGTGAVVEILMCSEFRPRLPGLTKMLSKLGKEGSWKKALELFEAAVSIGLCDPDTALTNAAVSACDKGGQWQKAVEYFDKFERMGIKRDAITYSATINALGKGKQWEAALKVFDHMKTSGVGADVVTCCSLINALEKSGQWEMAERLFYYMKGDPVPVNNEVQAELAQGTGTLPLTSPNSVLKSVLRHNSLISRLETVNEDNLAVPDDDFGSLGFICTPDEHVRTPVSAGSDQSFNNPNKSDGNNRKDSFHCIGTPGYVPQDLLMEFASLGMDSGVSAEVELPDAQNRDSIRRSSSCFPAMVDQNAQTGVSSELVNKVDFSHARGVQPNRVCCNALMGAFARARPTQWKKAVDFVAYLWTQDDSIQPDVITYNTALKACSSAFQLRQIEALLEDMESRGVEPNTATLQFITEAAIESHSSAFLKNVMCWFERYPNIKDKCSSQLVVACMRCNMREEAVELFENRLTSNSHGISDSSDAIFSGLIMQKDCDAVVRLLDLMCEMRVLPSINTCSSLIEFLCRNDNWELSTNLLRTMVTQSESPFSDRMVSVSTVNVILRAMRSVINKSPSPSNQAKTLAPQTMEIFSWIGDKIPCRANQDTFCLVIQILAMAEEYINVLMVNRTMGEQGCYPDQETMSYILLASFEKGDRKNSMRLMSQLLSNGVVFNNMAISKGFEVSLASGEWQLAVQICECLERQHLSPESVVFMYQAILVKVLDTGDNETALRILTSLQNKPHMNIDSLLSKLTGQSISLDGSSQSESDSIGSLFFTGGNQGSPSQSPSNRDIIDGLLDEWINTGILAHDIQDRVVAMRINHDCPTPEDLLAIVRCVAENGQTDKAVRMCCSLNTRAAALDFYRVPNMYSNKQGEKHQWQQDIQLSHLGSDDLMIQVIVASWVLAAQEAVSWDLGMPPFDSFNVRIGAETPEELGKISLGLIQLLTRGHSRIIPPGTIPHFHEASFVTLFQQSETSVVIEIDVKGLSCLTA